MENKINFIGYLNKETDYKPQCHKCGYSSHVWSVNEEWVCKECLIESEIKLIIEHFEKILIE